MTNKYVESRLDDLFEAFRREYEAGRLAKSFYEDAKSYLSSLRDLSRNGEKNSSEFNRFYSWILRGEDSFKRRYYRRR